MTDNKNFKWLTNDIYSTLVLKVMSDKDTILGVFNISGILETTGEKLEVETANIDDLTNLLTLGMVRFTNVLDNSDILDIPFRNLYKLYKNANTLDANEKEKFLPFKEIDIFSVINGVVRNDLLLSSTVINKVSDDLNEVMRIASDFGNYGMQEKFDAMTKVTMINHRRLMSDKKENL